MVEQFEVYWVPCHVDGRDGEIVTDQIRTVDKRRLKKKISSLSLSEQTALQNVLRQMFCE